MAQPGSRWFRFELDRGRGLARWDVRVATEAEASFMRGACGICNRRARAIFVDPTMDGGDHEIGSTVLHEMMHAAWPLRRLHDNEEEERVVRALEQRLWPVLVANGLRWPERGRR
jgi:hypothetical protein